jgi:hypothetical protein
VTLYLLPQTVDNLDRVWLTRRMEDPKAQQFQIIEELIMTALKTALKKEERVPL